jgi:hypothetical protein
MSQNFSVVAQMVWKWWPLPQSKYEACDKSLDSRGFFDEAGYEDDPVNFFSQFFSNTGHQLAMPF